MSENKKVIYIVGMGPGSISGMSGDAVEALHKSDMIIGYTVYVDLVRQHFPDKELKTTPMRQEIERCRICFDYAMEEKQVAMICSGDAGVYGMAAPMFEMAEGYPEVELVVIPGVTAANSGAAVLGAPLNHDYCVISLSDLFNTLGKDRGKTGGGDPGGFCHCHLQSVQS